MQTLQLLRCLLLLGIGTGFLACESPTTTASTASTTSSTLAEPAKAPTATTVVWTDTAPPPNFPWLETYPITQQLQRQIAVPRGYKRLVVAPNSFAHWLRTLPLQAEGSPVLLYNGQQKPYQAGAFRVLNIDIGSRDLQQCADAVMRLRAEYLYQQKDYNNIHFNYTSGHTIRFSDWAKGKRPKVKGSKVYFSTPSGTADYSYKQFKRYLTNVYSYAGTASLSKELPTKALKDIEAGDVFIQGGFPGHAVLVMDVAEHIQTGARLFLLAQSYMPAQSIHLLKNPNNADLSPWYSNDFTGVMQTPEWNFEAHDLRQFSD